MQAWSLAVASGDVDRIRELVAEGRSPDQPIDSSGAAGDTGLGDEAIGRGWWTTRAGGAGSVTSEMAAALLPPALPALTLGSRSLPSLSSS